MSRKKASPQDWGSSLLGEVLSESLGKIEGEMDIVTFCKQILRIDPWVTQRAILKSFLREPLDTDEVDLLLKWRDEGKCNWYPDREYKNLVVEAGMRSSKCVTGDSLLATSAGVVRADELLPTTDAETGFDVPLMGITIQTRQGDKPVVGGFTQGAKPGFRIVTERGLTLGGSTIHPVLQAHSGFVERYRRQAQLPIEAPTKWTTLEDIDVGDWIVTQLGCTAWGHDRQLKYPGPYPTNGLKLPAYMSPELAQLLAICQARLQRLDEGHLVLSVGSGDTGLQETLNDLTKALFNYELPERAAPRADGTVGIHARDLIRFLSYLGLSGKRDEIEVPPLVRQSGRLSLKAYLSAYLTHAFELGRYGSERQLESAVLGSPSPTFLKELASLLTLFGVRSRFDYGHLASRAYGAYLRFELDDWVDLNQYVFDDRICAPYQSVDRIVRKYPITAPMYDVCVPEIEEFVANGIVVHNTAICSILIAYLIYKLYQMEDPGRHYEQLSGQPLYITTVATSEEQSKDTIFGYVCTRLEQSPYFQNLARQEKLFIGKTRIEFPEKNLVIRAGHSNQAGLVGTTAPAFIMDEANRFAQETGVNGLDMYENVGKATKSFAKWPDMGFRMVISSAWETGDVTDTLIDMAKRDETGITKTLFFKLTTYEMNPTVTRDDFADTYELRPEKALRDFENIRPGSTERILNEVMVQRAMDVWAEQVGTQVAAFEDGTEIEEGQAYVIKQLLGKVKRHRGVFTSYAALDVGISGDSYALCVGHGVADPTGGGVIAIIDLLTSWKPFMDLTGRQHIVKFDNVEDIFLQIARELMVAEVHSDRYNSEGSLQLFNRNGILPVRSSETNAIQYRNYMMFKTGLNQGKVWLPNDKQLFKEAKHVQLIHGKKIDHPEYFDDKTPGAKDLLDVVTKVVARIFKDDGKIYSYHETKGGDLPTQMASRLQRQTALNPMQQYLQAPSAHQVRQVIGRNVPGGGNRFGW